jgi:hypothetical protein
VSTVVYIMCDLCGRRSSDDFRNAGQAINFTVRPMLQAKGWRSNPRAGRDYCPECVRAGKAPKARKEKT